MLAALALAALCVAPALAAGTSADVAAFNDTLAAQSAPCQAMVNMLNLVHLVGQAHPEDPQIVGFARMANAAKVCATKVHAETNDQVPARLPRSVLMNACAILKARLLKNDKMERAQTSWACGWSSPIPDYRPVPGFW